MTENERIINLLILFLLLMAKNGYELYMNHVSLLHIFDYSLFIGPVLLTFGFGMITETYLWMREEEKKLLTDS